MWKNFQNFQKISPNGLQDISIRIDQNSFLGLAKNKAATLH